ncbi:MAG: FliI/YscN family ATPase [Planctomycetota bacterium]
MRPPFDLARYRERLATIRKPSPRGRVHTALGITVEATGLTCRIGDLCLIKTDRAETPALVLGFRDTMTVLMPTEDLTAIAPGCEVIPAGHALDMPVAESLLGRVIDPLGQPLDGKPLPLSERVPLLREPPSPMTRPSIARPCATGVKSVDALLTVGYGQRLGIFAGSGVGKSTLLGMIARQAESDVNVIALIGERGREVNHFLDDVLGERGRQRSVVVVATSDAPPVRRYLGAFSGVAVAEYFRDRGRNVLFVMDSVTRFAMALREIGLAMGEPPTSKGYPPSVFGLLPRIVERLGTSPRGTVTGVFTVLVEGDDLSDPVADSMRSLLDGHVVLARDLAQRGHYPPVDVLRSVSRVMPQIVGAEHNALAQRFRELLATYERNRDLVDVGAYQRGSNPLLDEALRRIASCEAFLKQGAHESFTLEHTLALLKQVLA